MKTEAETGAMYLYAKESQGLPTAPEARREVRKESPSEPPAETNIAKTLISDFSPSELWENKFLLF